MKKADTDVKEKKSGKKFKKKSKKKKLITLIVFPLVIAVLTGITYICGGFEAIDYFLFYRHRVIDQSVISDGSFPVNFSGGDIITAENISSKVAVLNKNLLTCVSYKGRVLYTENLSFVEPQMVTDGKYGVVFDRGSDGFLIFNAYGIVYRGTVEDGRSIITADVDSKGNVVFSTKSNDAACRVYMIDKYGEIKYIWSCAENYVVSMDIAKDSEKIVCGAIGAYDYEIFTDIYVLDIYSDAVVSQYRAENSACVEVMYVNGGKDKIVLNCTDKRLVFDVNNDGVLDGHPSVTAFKGDIVLMDSDALGNTTVLTGRYNSQGTKELMLYDKDNNIVFSGNVEAEVISVLCAGNKVYCLTENSILTYNKDAEKNTEFSCEAFGEGLVELRGKIRYYSSKSIKNGF